MRKPKEYYSFRALMRRNPAVAKVLAGLYVLTSSADETAVGIQPLADLVSLDYKKTRRCLRTLWRRGFARPMHGLWTERGPAGSGYGITKEGEQAVEEWVWDIIQHEVGRLSAQLV